MNIQYVFSFALFAPTGDVSIYQGMLYLMALLLCGNLKNAVQLFR